MPEHPDYRPSVGDAPLPEATVARLPLYWQVLVERDDEGVTTVSSQQLGRAAGVTPAQVRKDLSQLGSPGIRGVGYQVDQLLTHLSQVLGLTREWRVVLVGIGNLGRALTRYEGFAERGFEIVALVDADPERIGTRVAGLEVESADRLPAIVAREGIAIGILAVPAAAADEVARQLVDAGVTALLNFAPAALRVPDHIHVRRVDLASELGILAYHAQRRAGATPLLDQQGR